MHDGDLILTPPMWLARATSMTAINRIIWFDAANIPLLRHARCEFFSSRATRRPTRFWQVDEGDEPRVGPSPASSVPTSRHAAEAFAENNRYGGATRPPPPARRCSRPGTRRPRAMCAYVDPSTGGSVMPALDCHGGCGLTRGVETRAAAHEPAT